MQVENSVAFYRKFHELTQVEFAKMCGISVNSLIRLENFQTDPPLSRMLTVSRVLKMPLEELFFEKGKNPPRRIPESLDR